MTEQLKRYDITPNPYSPFGSDMEESETGEWVKASDIPKIKADAVREYVSNSMESHWILHLNENNLFDRLLINLNEYADKLERGEV